MKYFVIIFICPMVFFLVDFLYFTFVSYFYFCIPITCLYRYCLVFYVHYAPLEEVVLDLVLIENLCVGRVVIIFQTNCDYLKILGFVGSS